MKLIVQANCASLLNSDVLPFFSCVLHEGKKFWWVEKLFSSTIRFATCNSCFENINFENINKKQEVQGTEGMVWVAFMYEANGELVILCSLNVSLPLFILLTFCLIDSTPCFVQGWKYKKVWAMLSAMMFLFIWRIFFKG